MGTKDQPSRISRQGSAVKDQPSKGTKDQPSKGTKDQP